MKKLLNAAKIILSVLLALLPVAVICVTAVSKIRTGMPFFFGYSVSIVVSPSMAEFPVGTLILSKAYKSGEGLQEGQIITYLGESGSYAGKLITHAVESITENEKGEKIIIARGSNNASSDPAIGESAVKAVYIGKLGYLGGLYRLFTQKIGILFLIASAAFVYASVSAVRLTLNLKKSGIKGNGDKEDENSAE